MLRKKKHAFTLAEVLLALVIVGIIAGLVLPSLLKDMQAIVTGLSGNSIAHAFQAKLFNAQGFTKLAERYEEHATEERDFVEKYVDRIMDLGGKIVLEDIKGQPLYTDIIDYLKSEEKISVD